MGPLFSLMKRNFKTQNLIKEIFYHKGNILVDLIRNKANILFVMNFLMLGF